MPKRYLLPLSALCIGLPLIVFVLPRLLIGKPLADSIGQYQQWQPTPEDIRKAVGVISNGSYSDDSHTRFAKMFQERFRSNQKAVGVTFFADDGIKAKFAATIPRWDMAAVSLQLHREAKEVFRRNVNVDIYETYISMTPIKLGELRDTGDGQPIHVQFDPHFAMVQQAEADLQSFGGWVLTRASTPRNLPNPLAWMADSTTQDRRVRTRRSTIRLVPAAVSSTR